MNYYQDLLAQISPPESAVDCARCSMEWKCCTYRPFIANFLVGSFAGGPVWIESLFEEWDFLIVGFAPNIKYRRHFFKKGKWGFGTDATLLCTFYEKKSGGCQIWSARPAVCRTFFCKSSYNEAGAYYWKNAEDFTWLLEWVLLEDFLYHKGWTLEDVQWLKKYLDDSQVNAGLVPPQDFIFSDLSKAETFYKEAHQYVQGLSPETVMELIGAKGGQLYQELLAQKLNLR